MLISITLHALYVGLLYAAGRLHQQRIDARARTQARLGDPVEWNEVAK